MLSRRITVRIKKKCFKFWVFEWHWYHTTYRR